MYHTRKFILIPDLFFSFVFVFVLVFVLPCVCFGLHSKTLIWRDTSISTMCQKWFVPAPILLSISFEIGVTTVATFNLANWYSIEMFDGIGFHWGQLVKTFQKVKVNWNWNFGVRPLFRSFDSPFWKSTSLIWLSSEQKIDLQSIQQFNSWQLLQSSSAAKLYDTILLSLPYPPSYSRVEFEFDVYCRKTKAFRAIAPSSVVFQKWLEHLDWTKVKRFWSPLRYSAL